MISIQSRDIRQLATILFGTPHLLRPEAEVDALKMIQFQVQFERVIGPCDEAIHWMTMNNKDRQKTDLPRSFILIQSMGLFIHSSKDLHRKLKVGVGERFGCSWILVNT